MKNRTGPRPRLWLAILLAAPLLAQYAEVRAVRGHVTFRDGEPARGAVVQLQNTRTLQIRSYITRQDGAFHFEGLSPDVDYQLRPQYHGKFSPAKNLSQFNSAKTATVDLKLDDARQ